jgi:hypothetical protein
MHKHVFAVFQFDKPEPFPVIKPFHRSLASHSAPLSTRGLHKIHPAENKKTAEHDTPAVLSK